MQWLLLLLQWLLPLARPIHACCIRLVVVWKPFGLVYNRHLGCGRALQFVLAGQDRVRMSCLLGLDVCVCLHVHLIRCMHAVLLLLLLKLRGLHRCALVLARRVAVRWRHRSIRLSSCIYCLQCSWVGL